MNRRATDAPGFAFLHGAVAEKGPLPLQRTIDTIESSCTARPTKIGRHDVLDRFREQVELPQTRQGPTRDIVRLEQVNLAGGERRVRQQFEQPRLNLSHREGDWPDSLPASPGALGDGGGVD